MQKCFIPQFFLMPISGQLHWFSRWSHVVCKLMRKWACFSLDLLPSVNIFPIRSWSKLLVFFNCYFPTQLFLQNLILVDGCDVWGRISQRLTLSDTNKSYDSSQLSNLTVCSNNIHLFPMQRRVDKQMLTIFQLTHSHLRDTSLKIP